jgi:hypothetical protein
MSWLFSQVLVEEYLGDISSDGEQSVPSSGSSTQQAYLPPDKMTDFSRLFRFGMTYKPLTESRGQELLTLYLEDFRAKTSQRQGKELESTESDQECGEKWRGSFVKYDPDTSLWKTHQCSLLGDLEPFLETWPQWGLMRDGECWEQRTLEQSIRGTEYGLSEKLPTPQATDHRSKPTSASWKAKGGVNFSLANPEIQMNWPTPNARDWKDSQTAGNRKSPGLGVVAHWPTPRTKGMCGGTGSWDLLNKNTTVEEARLMGAGNGGQLNPEWVEKLMGWPNDWCCIDNITHTKMMFWVMGFYDDEERCASKVLQMLREGNISQEIQQQIGRHVDILEATILLVELCKYSNRPYEARILVSCKEVFEEEMRGLRSQQITSSASHRSGHQEQSPKQHTDTLQALSRLLAHHGKEAWKTGSWEDATPRVKRDITARVDRLKAIGNGQVPLCAATAWRVLNEAGI